MPDTEQPIVKTPAQLEQEKRIADRKAAKEKAKADAAALKAKRDALKDNVGKSFGGATVTGFYPDKALGPVIADAYLVNFGNPNHSKFIFCEEFLEENAPKV